MQAKYCSSNLKRGYCISLEDMGVDGRIILTSILNSGCNK
jgi:hypothetical protein